MNDSPVQAASGHPRRREAEELGLPVRPDGEVDVGRLIATSRIEGASYETLREHFAVDLVRSDGGSSIRLTALWDDADGWDLEIEVGDTVLSSCDPSSGDVIAEAARTTLSRNER